MTRITDMTPLTTLPATGALAPVEKDGVNYRYDLGALLRTNLDGLLVNAPTLSIPDDIDAISTTGADALDHGGANYVAGTAPTARSGFTSANTRNFVLSKEQVITPQMFYTATDPDFQNAMQGALDYVAATAGNVIAPWYRGGTKIVWPANSTPYELHASLEPAYTGIIEGEDSGFHDAHSTILKWTAGTCGFIFQDINTSGTSGTRSPDGYAPSGFILRNLFGKGGLGEDSTEGEFHFVLARTRVILENLAGANWQGDGINVTADLSAPSLGEASLSQISTVRLTHVRNGVAIHGADANVINIKSADVVYARHWGILDNSFLAIRAEACHAAACGISNPGYTPTVASLAGNLYAVVYGQEVAASTNAPSGTTADNAYWYYMGAGGPDAGLNWVAWTSGMVITSGGAYLSSGGGACSTFDDCYSEGAQGPSQFPHLAKADGGLHGAGIKGAYVGALNGKPMALDAFIVADTTNSAIQTEIGSGRSPNTGIFRHANPIIGGVNALALTFPTFLTDVLCWTNWQGDFSPGSLAFQISMNNSTVGNAPWGQNKVNLPAGYGFADKKRLPATVAPTTARLVGDYDINTAPTATTPLKWITTVGGTPGTQILHFPNLRADPSTGVGYVTGAGGAVTQITSRTTGVTLDKVCGAITLFSAAGSAAYATFTVTNSAVAATDVVRVVQKSGADKYIILVTAVGAGSFDITFATTGGTTTEQPVFNFAVVKAVAA